MVNYSSEDCTVNRHKGEIFIAKAIATFKILEGYDVGPLYFGTIPENERELALAGAKQALLDDVARDNSPVKLGANYTARSF